MTQVVKPLRGPKILEEMREASMEFKNTVTQFEVMAGRINQNGNFEIHTKAGKYEFDSLILGIYIKDAMCLKWFQFDENNEASKNEKKLYQQLIDFANEHDIPEMQEQYTAFIPANTPLANMSRRFTPPEIYRNEQEIVESIYPMDELIAIATKALDAKGWIQMPNGNDMVQIAILDPTPIKLED